ncbi:MAG: D-glycero-beta-D-manno-heptose-7-phosphate kinase [Deltaproteobacteria bacterium]|nr:D-glycero-beta-D-manno-heptose-7-phosphate kinase [Deltaproteobacteria bacterium]
MLMNIASFKKCRALIIGDLMIDEYLWGKVDRISPEAPVQVVSVTKNEFTLGGAGNVVNNIVSLGAKISVIGVVGTGPDGDLLLKQFEKLGIDISGILQENGRITTKKTRIIAASQHVLRIDSETKKELSDNTAGVIAEFIEKKIPEVDVVLISDYGKGIITQKLLSGLLAVAKKHQKIVIADPKGMDYSKYSGISLITPNKKEAALAAGMEIIDEPTLFKAGEKILQKAAVERLLITCGKDGMVLFDKKKKPHKIMSEARQVYDVSGAGDTVLAVLGLAIASGESFEKSAYIANKAAGIVVGKMGTATVSQEELLCAINPRQDRYSLKRKTLPELVALVKELQKKGKKVVFANGCFDLLHSGHIKFFTKARKLGDALIVALDDDESVKSLKGRGRPVLNVRERIQIMCALDSIDYVTVFSTGELKNMIKQIQPDILAKGSNYSVQKVYGRELVEEYGGRVVLIPVTDKISSTGIINNIRNA